MLSTLKLTNQRLGAPLFSIGAGVDVMYGTYHAAHNNQNSQPKWVRIALAYLAGTWDGVTVTEDNCAWNVAVTLSITNNGFEKAAKNSVRLYLRGEAQFDEGDALLPVILKVKRQKPEVTVDVPVDYPYDIALAGKYLIIVIDPERLTSDRNMTDNIVTVELQL